MKQSQTSMEQSEQGVQPLPKALHPWREWLEWFSPELIPTIATLLQRLNPLLGPQGRGNTGKASEPNGFGNIQRSGDYSRLLLSEWLLADELPDEFLRRAAHAEHLFLTADVQQTHTESLTIVLFDCGPSQLGCARLVHIALLILLARRAVKTGGKILWGVLQNTPELFDFSSPEQLKRLLGARTYQPVSNEHIIQWQDWLMNSSIKASESWTISAVRVECPWKGAHAYHYATIQPSWDGDALNVHLISRAFHRQIALPLPNEGEASRILKGTWHTAAALQDKSDGPRISIQLPPFISTTGSSVGFMLLDKRAIMLCNIPQYQSSQKSKYVPKVIEIPSKGSVLAMICHGKTASGMLSRDDELHFWQMPGIASMVRPPNERFQATASRARLLSAAYLVHKSYNVDCAGFYVLDMANRLIFFPASTKKIRVNSSPVTLAHNVLGIVKMNDKTLVYLRRNSQSVLEQVITAVSQDSSASQDDVDATLHQNSDRQRFLLDYNSPQITQALFASWMRNTEGYPCAIQLNRISDAEIWRIYPLSVGTPSADVTLPEGWKAIGLYCDDADSYCSLILLSQNKMNIARYCGGAIEMLYSSESAIIRHTYCPASKLLAILTESKELIVYSVYQNAVRLRFSQKGKGDDE